MTHSELWNGIVNLAAKMNMSCSRLALAAGLDATTFNKSKRFNRDGTPRWPSTYCLARMMDAAGLRLSEFASLMPNDTPNEYVRPKPNARTHH